MRTVVEGKADVKKILGRQQLKNVKYRLMKYVLQDECKDGILLYNAITGQMIILDREEVSALNCLSNKNVIIPQALIEDYYLVPENYDEKTTVDTLRKLMKKVFAQKGINGFTIMTTTNCNARCYYCYQANYSHTNMSQETANRLIEYMERNNSNKALHIQWFGGEPLVGIDRIDQIANALNAKGIEFASSMISNGYLFTESIVERAAKNWHLKNVQITLDGTEEVYNRTKAYVSAEGRSPFRRVFENINILLNCGLHVGIRLNLDQHNMNDLDQLVTEITQRIPNQENLTVYTHTVYENEGYAPIERDEDIRKQLFDFQLHLNRSIIDKGLSKRHYSLPSLKYRSCMADNANAVVVYPNGQLFKCEHTYPEDAFGHIESELKKTAQIIKYTIPSELNKCAGCQIYPTCFILKACDGLKDRNDSICEFDIELRKRAMEYQYKQYKDKARTIVDG